MITKKFKRKTITICPGCRGIADMTRTGSTVVLIEPCLQCRIEAKITERLEKLEYENLVSL